MHEEGKLEQQPFQLLQSERRARLSVRTEVVAGVQLSSDFPASGQQGFLLEGDAQRTGDEVRCPKVSLE